MVNLDSLELGGSGVCALLDGLACGHIVLWCAVSPARCFQRSISEREGSGGRASPFHVHGGLRGGCTLNFCSRMALAATAAQAWKALTSMPNALITTESAARASGLREFSGGCYKCRRALGPAWQFGPSVDRGRDLLDRATARVGRHGLDQCRLILRTALGAGIREEHHGTRMCRKGPLRAHPTKEQAYPVAAG